MTVIDKVPYPKPRNGSVTTIPDIHIDSIGIHSDIDGFFVTIETTGELFAPGGLDGYKYKSEAIEALGRIAGRFGFNQSLPEREVVTICFDTTRK